MVSPGSVSQKLQGSVALTCVILIWVGSAWLIQLVFTSSDLNFDKPLFLTYYSTNWFMVYLIPMAIRYCVLKKRAQ
jgi:hypothetical protein